MDPFLGTALLTALRSPPLNVILSPGCAIPLPRTKSPEQLERKERQVMKRKQLFVLKMVLVVLISGAVPEVYAREGNGAAEALCQYGKRLYKQGDLENAIHEFSKALIVDPENETAKSYLRKMGLAEGLYSGEKTDRSRVVQLVRDLRQLKQDIVVDGALGGYPRDPHPNAVTKIIIPARQDPFAGSYTQAKAQQPAPPTPAQNEEVSMTDVSGPSSGEVALLTEKNRELYENTEKLKEKERDLCPKHAARKARQETADDSSIRSEGLLVRVDDGDQAKVKLEEADALYKTSKLNAVTDLALVRDLENALRDGTAGANQQELSTLDRALNKKDETINALREQLAKVEEQLRRSGYALEDKSAPEILQTGEGTLGIGDYLKLIRKKDHCIAELKTGLADALRKLSALKTASPGQVPPANGEIQGRLLEKDVLIKTKDENITKLTEEIADVSERLGLAQKIIQSKDEQIKTLTEDVKRLRGNSSK